MTKNTVILRAGGWHWLAHWILLCGVVCCSLSVQAQQAVQLESTISGNQEQPKTIYVLPWQQPIGQIRIPPTSLQPAITKVSPLDRQQFLRFIAVQQGTVQTHSVNAEKQQ